MVETGFDPRSVLYHRLYSLKISHTAWPSFIMIFEAVNLTFCTFLERQGMDRDVEMEQRGVVAALELEQDVSSPFQVWSLCILRPSISLGTLFIIEWYPLHLHQQHPLSVQHAQVSYLQRSSSVSLHYPLTTTQNGCYQPHVAGERLKYGQCS